MFSFIMTQHLGMKFFVDMALALPVILTQSAPQKLTFVEELYAKRNRPKNYVQYCIYVIFFKN